MTAASTPLSHRLDLCGIHVLAARDVHVFQRRRSPRTVLVAPRRRFRSAASRHEGAVVASADSSSPPWAVRAARSHPPHPAPRRAVSGHQAHSMAGENAHSPACGWRPRGPAGTHDRARLAHAVPFEDQTLSASARVSWPARRAAGETRRPGSAPAKPAGRPGPGPSAARKVVAYAQRAVARRASVTRRRGGGTAGGSLRPSSRHASPPAGPRREQRHVAQLDC